MISLTTLKSRTAKDLAALAKCKRVPGWHAMRKEALIKALVKLARVEEARSAKSAKKPSANGNGSAAKVATVAAKSLAKVGSNGNGRSVSGNGVSGNGAVRHAGSGGVSGNGGAHAFGANRRTSRGEKRLDAMRTKLAQNKDLSFSSQDAGRARAAARRPAIAWW